MALTPNEEEGQPPLISTAATQRVIMSPQHAKAFLEVLGQNVTEWERQFGEIRLVPQDPNPPQ